MTINAYITKSNGPLIDKKPVPDPGPLPGFDPDPYPWAPDPRPL